jgi:hypothetical protein
MSIAWARWYEWARDWSKVLADGTRGYVAR